MGAVYPLTIDQGSTFQLRVRLLRQDKITPIDISNYQAKAQVRSSKSQNAPLLAQFDISGSLDTSGTFYIAMSSSVADTLPSGLAFYDVVLFAGNGAAYQERPLEGPVIINGRVTSQ